MTGWKECKLSDVINFGNGKVRPKTDGLIPVYGGNGVLGFCDQFNYKEETIIIGRVGAYCGAVFYENKPIWVSDNALAAKQKGFNDTKFLYYFLKNLGLNQLAEGSSHPLVTQTLLNSIEIVIPCDGSEQRAIASVLSSLDDKIDCLHRQNKTLESMAETLFRQWFIEEAEINSESQILLGSLIETISTTHAFSKLQVIFLNTSDIYLGDVLKHSYESTKELPGQAKKTIRKNDILFSEIRPANGRYAYIDFEANDYVVSTKLMVLRSKGVLSQAFVYFYLTNRKTLEWLQTLAEARSGTFPQITFDQLRDLAINVPSEKLLSSASQLCDGWLRKIKFNHAQIRTLEKMRDTLITKLMSGEVRVKS